MSRYPLEKIDLYKIEQIRPVVLFRDPFGVIESIGNMISNIGDNGISGLIALLVVVLWYRSK